MKTQTILCATDDDSVPLESQAGITIEPGPTGPSITLWCGAEDEARKITLPPTEACACALELLRQALHTDYSAALDDTVQRAIYMVALAGDIARNKQTHDRPDDPPRGVHAH